MSADAAFTPIPLHAGNPGPITGGGNWTYLVAGRDASAMLIDAGVGETSHLAALEAALRATGTTLDSLVVTHGHSDHVKGAPALVAAYPHLVCLKYPWSQEDGRFGVPWVPLVDGQRIVTGETTLEAVHTPGHSPDHCVLWHAASGTAFIGDLIVPGGSVVIQPSRGGSMRQYLASLERLSALAPRRLLPAHGPPIDDAEMTIRRAVKHRQGRERQVAAAMVRGLATVSQIAESIYHGLSPALMPMARETVRAHLDKLNDESRAVEHEGRWTLLE